MPENTEQVEKTAPAGKTFTQAEMDAIIGDRLARERAKYADYNEVKAKAAKYDEVEEAQKTELQKTVEERDALKAQVEKLNAEKEHAKAVADAATKYGVDASLLSRMTGDVEANAEFLKQTMANTQKYGHVKDGGEATPPTVTRESVNAIKDPVSRVRERASLIAKERVS